MNLQQIMFLSMYQHMPNNVFLLYSLCSSDIDMSDMTFDSDLECNSEEGEEIVGDYMELSEDSRDVSSDSEYSSEELDNDWRLVAVGVDQADALCVRLNELIRRGIVTPESIFYKYINDVVEFMYDSRHKYDDEVVEFFNTLTYLGGRQTTNMIRNPMFKCQGRGSSHQTSECRMNLGGPSEETCRKKQAGYTTASGVQHCLLSAFHQLSQKSNAKLLIDNAVLQVVPCAVANDGTALKPSIQFDARAKENIGLDFEVSATFVKDNLEPSPQLLRDHIITEVLVSSLTPLDNSCSLPFAADYVPKKGKTGPEMKKLFESQCSIAQICQNCLVHTSSTSRVLSDDNCNICNCFCRECFEMETICNNCKRKGQVSTLPSLRACEKCLDAGIKCYKC